MKFFVNLASLQRLEQVEYERDLKDRPVLPPHFAAAETEAGEGCRRPDHHAAAPCQELHSLPGQWHYLLAVPLVYSTFQLPTTAKEKSVLQHLLLHASSW